MDLIVILGYVIIFFIVRHVILSVKRQRREKHQELVKYLNEVIHQVQVEHHHGIEYWFDQHNNRFLGQGSSVDEVINVLKSRFPDHIFLLEDRGGICAKTNWQLVSFDQFKNLNFTSAERI